MCDYSLQHAKSRPAAVSDKLTVRDFGRGTRGFASAEDSSTAVCVLPGTELVFDADIRKVNSFGPVVFESVGSAYRVAIFRQYNKEDLHMHHDGIEFPDGNHVLLTVLTPGQKATVLQLPAAPKTAQEAKDQERLAVAG